MILDVHNLSLNEALDEILYKLDECKECGENILQIIHGHKHGTTIRDYIRSSSFISEMAKNGNEFVKKSFSQEGVSIFQLKLSTTSSKKPPIPKPSTIERKDETNLTFEICLKCNETMFLIKEFNWYQCPKCGKLKKG